MYQNLNNFKSRIFLTEDEQLSGNFRSVNFPKVLVGVTSLPNLVEWKDIAIILKGWQTELQ